MIVLLRLERSPRPSWPRFCESDWLLSAKSSHCRLLPTEFAQLQLVEEAKRAEALPELQ